jgi:hypothetical protein
MPSNKDFKRLVRVRMEKTGESYTAARAVLLNRIPVERAADFASLAGMSDDAVKAKTGCTWERWVRALDAVKAHQWPHDVIARYVREKYHTPSWWTQMVTVGYERIRGLRERGQQRSGDYRTNKSKTLPASLSRVYRAFSQARMRAQWLPGVGLTVRNATPNKYLRIIWEDGTQVNAGFVARARSKAQVAVEHGKLPSKEAADRMKRYWTERLEALATLLAG